VPLLVPLLMPLLMPLLVRLLVPQFCALFYFDEVEVHQSHRAQPLVQPQSDFGPFWVLVSFALKMYVYSIV
jgi:hypothetical protein